MAGYHFALSVITLIYYKKGVNIFVPTLTEVRISIILAKSWVKILILATERLRQSLQTSTSFTESVDSSMVSLYSHAHLKYFYFMKIIQISTIFVFKIFQKVKTCLFTNVNLIMYSLLCCLLWLWLQDQ